ncbi:MAG: TonB-dependent receptor [Acidobacteria bacterium]|nr:TonB-dependent receptor [Acidobacteriota bacterium]
MKTSITVSGAIAAEAPANVSTLGRLEIRETPGINLDDRLRDLPGFSLFRRSSSLVAHPTTQGISLRGIGSSGASRTLVLWDGAPVNDPFGGWVYWTRFPPEELESVEISRGASTSVFGDRALGGAIVLLSRPAERDRLSAGYEGGNRDSHDLWTGYSDLGARWGFSGHARAYTTGGYFIVPERARGPVDLEAGLRFLTANLRADYFGGSERVFLKADLLAEERHNGTRLQNNSTGLGSAALHYQRDRNRDAVSLRAFHTREEFRSAFSAIGAGRRTETLTFRQTVPAEGTGGAAVWRRSGGRWNGLAGGDVFRVAGYSTDSLFPSGRRVGGGEQLQHGVFLQGDFAAGPAQFFLGARHHFTGQDRNFFSPSAGLAAGRGRLRARASVYRSFRAPTLNELFREFRAGNAVTQANAALRPETLFGAEAGLDVRGETSNLRVTFFRNSIGDLITNVTLSSTPSLIVRQRQNAASALSRGAEINAARRWRDWRGEAGYLFVDSRFATGERVPQIPRHQGSAQLSFERGGTLASAGIRSYAAQFEDERNVFLLPGFATLQLVVRQRLAGGLSAVLAFENLLDREYLAGFSPTPIVGGPRLWRAGLRWEGRLR